VQPFQLRDLRRTYRTIHGRIGTPPHIAERLINHISSTSELERTYDRWAYLPDMRMAVLAFENHLSEIVGVGNLAYKAPQSSPPLCID
jgi:hypothetical protein